jgi:hypothetical protein
MEPLQQAKSPEIERNEKKRFQIVKLEERVAPSHGHHNTSTSSGTLSVPSVIGSGRG